MGRPPPPAASRPGPARLIGVSAFAPFVYSGDASFSCLIYMTLGLCISLFSEKTCSQARPALRAQEHNFSDKTCVDCYQMGRMAGKGYGRGSARVEKEGQPLVIPT